MAQQYLALSLFVILLCFFIVLNSMSNFETVKTENVMQSVQMAFSGKTAGDNALPSVQMTPTETFEKGTALDKIKALFKAQIKTFKANTNRLGTEMMVRLPLAEFEAAVSSVGAAGGMAAQNPRAAKAAPFLPTLISLIDTAQSEIPYRMDILLNIPENPASLPTDDPARFKALLRQASQYSDTLERAGMPRKLVSSGLSEGTLEHSFDGQGGPYIELYFRRYEPVDPLSGERMDAP